VNGTKWCGGRQNHFVTSIFGDITIHQQAIMSIPRDVQEFLDHYPGSTDTPSRRKNLEFYSNQRRCQPDDLLIEELLEQWKDDFMTLEYEHGFIQWLYVLKSFINNVFGNLTVMQISDTRTWHELRVSTLANARNRSHEGIS
jgi:hypothetical protein